MDVIRPTYGFDVTCPGTVPQAFSAFLEANDYEDAIRIAVSLGGDSDTLACITGSLAKVLYPIPQWMLTEVRKRIAPALIEIADEFTKKMIKEGKS